MIHSLVLTDRGAQHTIRWRSSCSCGGWTGRLHRRQQEAVKEHRKHHLDVVRPLRRLVGYKPQPPTPVDQLPPELRMATA